jgi:hypothetical protein
MVWPPPQVPYFFSQNRFLKADWDRPGRFRHTCGHARKIEVLNELGKRALLHLVLDLDFADARLGFPAVGLTRLPLLHPFRHDGGSAKYRVISNEVIELLEITGKITHDWPYENYPERFAPHRFDLTDPVPCRLAEFEESMMQGVQPKHAGQFIAVLPDMLIGSRGLWSEEGGYTVNAVFAFDRRTRIVETYNETD